MSDTPRTDDIVNAFPQDWNHTYAASIISLARQLERELAVTRQEFADFKQNTIGVCAAWKRDYEGVKTRADAYMVEKQQMLAEYERMKVLLIETVTTPTAPTHSGMGGGVIIPIGWARKRDHILFDFSTTAKDER